MRTAATAAVAILVWFATAGGENAALNDWIIFCIAIAACIIATIKTENKNDNN